MVVEEPANLDAAHRADYAGSAIVAEGRVSFEWGAPGNGARRLAEAAQETVWRVGRRLWGGRAASQPEGGRSPIPGARLAVEPGERRARVAGRALGTPQTIRASPTLFKRSASGLSLEQGRSGNLMSLPLSADDWPMLEPWSRDGSAEPEQPIELGAAAWPVTMERRRGRALLADVSALGAGEPLPAAVRRPMERMFGRDFSAVRVHVSPLAEAFKAEAFTTGHHLVFRPGAWQPLTPAGLPLLAHELSHVGQRLAFRLAGGFLGGARDAAEGAARQVEEEVRRLVGRASSAGRTAMTAARSAAGRAAGALSGVGGEGAASEAIGRLLGARPAEAAPAGPGMSDEGASVETLPRGRLRELPGAAGGGGAPAAQPDLDKLARQVYAILKGRLRAERERYRLYD